ncbi:MAG: hypothetical protein U1A77_04990 [Pirellulales bacterium]
MKLARTLVLLFSATLVLGASLLLAQQQEQNNPQLPSLNETDDVQGDALRGDELTLILRRLPPVVDDLPARPGLERLPPVESEACEGLLRLPAATDELAFSSADLAGFDYPRTSGALSAVESREDGDVERLPSVGE